jgi:hypothetical protein
MAMAYQWPIRWRVQRCISLGARFHSDAGRFRGPFFLVAAGDWFGSQHMGPHNPREAPHVCKEQVWPLSLD